MIHFPEKKGEKLNPLLWKKTKEMTLKLLKQEYFKINT